MKTLKNTTIYGMILLLSIFLFSNANAGNDPVTQKSIMPVIRYEVIVHLTGDLPMCNRFEVVIKDSAGNLIAPAQTFQPGVTIYTFFEAGPVRKGIRVAKMEPFTAPTHLFCTGELHCQPDIKAGTFLNGQTYRYDLYPTTTPTKDND